MSIGNIQWTPGQKKIKKLQHHRKATEGDGGKVGTYFSQLNQ